MIIGQYLTTLLVCFSLLKPTKMYFFVNGLCVSLLVGFSIVASCTKDKCIKVFILFFKKPYLTNTICSFSSIQFNLRVVRSLIYFHYSFLSLFFLSFYFSSSFFWYHLTLFLTLCV